VLWSVGAFTAMARGSAHAEMPRNTPAAIEVDRDDAPAGRAGFGFDGGESVDAWGVSVAAGWLERPIRLTAGTFGAGTPATLPVRRRQTLSLGAALALGEAIVVDARLRASHQVGDRLHAAGDPAGLARYVLHDLRLGGRVRVAGDRDRAALLRAELTLPSGNAEQLAGDARWTAAWSLIGRATMPHGIVIAANAGVRLHGAEVIVGDRLIGDELFAAVGAAVPLPAVGGLRFAGPVTLTAELLGAIGDHVGIRSGPAPLEARLGVIVHPLAELTIGVHVGAGLDDQIGAPRWRGLLELAWTPRVAHRTEPASPDEAPDDPDDDPELAPAAPQTTPAT